MFFIPLAVFCRPSFISHFCQCASFINLREWFIFATNHSIFHAAFALDFTWIYTRVLALEIWDTLLIKWHVSINSLKAAQSNKIQSIYCKKRLQAENYMTNFQLEGSNLIVHCLATSSLATFFSVFISLVNYYNVHLDVTTLRKIPT